MGQDGEAVDVSRRDLGAFLTVLGGATGLAALTSCTAEVQGAPQSTGTASAPWNTADGGVAGTGFLWVDTIKGVGSSHTGTNLYSLPAGTDLSSASTPVVVVGGYWTPGDGGGGLFYWSNTAITDAGGTFIVPVASGGDGGVGAVGT